MPLHDRPPSVGLVPGASSVQAARSTLAAWNDDGDEISEAMVRAWHPEEFERALS
ncbi:MAG TPA: hypothetical protein VF332_06055 [Vicinamibacterales bacterium]